MTISSVPSASRPRPSNRSGGTDWLTTPPGSPQLEVEIHDHFRRLADQMTASLLAQATTTRRPGRAWKKGVPTPPAAADAPPNRGTLQLRLLGGLVVWIATTYCAPKAGTAKRRGQEGTGHYPELAALGIRKGAHPGAAIAGRPIDRLAPLDRVGARRAAPARPHPR